MLPEETYQVPERLFNTELPDLGSNVWDSFNEHEWRSPAASSSDLNSPSSQSLHNVMSPGPSQSLHKMMSPGPSQSLHNVMSPGPHIPPTHIHPMPPPYTTSGSTEHARSNSVPADIQYTFLTSDFNEPFDNC